MVPSFAEVVQTFFIPVNSKMPKVVKFRTKHGVVSFKTSRVRKSKKGRGSIAEDLGLRSPADKKWDEMFNAYARRYNTGK